MAYQRTIRPERSFEGCSYGLLIIKAIHKMWIKNEELISRGAATKLVNANIYALMEEQNLTLDEWHYWADIAGEALKGGQS